MWTIGCVEDKRETENKVERKNLRIGFFWGNPQRVLFKDISLFHFLYLISFFTAIILIDILAIVGSP